jgi:acyl-CoA thioesterase FadM
MHRTPYCIFLLIVDLCCPLLAFHVAYVSPAKQRRPAVSLAAAASSTTTTTTTLAMMKNEKPSTATATATEEDSTAAMSTFTTTSPIMQVYIEDTDAYGIMYNSNYLRSYDRALHLTANADSTSTSESNSTTTPNRSTPRCLRSQHEGWSIVSMGQQRFISPPALGGDFVVQATLQDHDDSDSDGDHYEVWDMAMTSPDGATVYNTVKNLQIAKPKTTNQNNNGDDDGDVGNIFSLANVEAFEFDNENDKEIPTTSNSKKTLVDTSSFTIYRDEIDAHWTGHLPLRNVLNLFERSRTNLFGGPENLRRLQDDDGVLAVVTGISDCSLIDEGILLTPGQQVTVETSLRNIKRRGMILECWQTLKCGSSRLAQGKVTLMMLDATKRRPTAKLPVWVQQKLGLAE